MDKIMNIWTFVKKHWEPIISVFSFALAMISLFRSEKAQKLQNRVNEMELKLKQYEIEKIEKEKEEASSSEVQARVVRLGDSKYKMKVWNSGHTTTFNVVARFEGNPKIIVSNNNIMPFDELAPNKNFDLWLIVHMGSALKFVIITEWKDELGIHHEKRQMGAL